MHGPVQPRVNAEAPGEIADGPRRAFGLMELTEARGRDRGAFGACVSSSSEACRPADSRWTAPSRDQEAGGGRGFGHRAIRFASARGRAPPFSRKETFA